MQYTANLGLKKPEDTEFGSNDDLNYNADIIDKLFCRADVPNISSAGFTTIAYIIGKGLNSKIRLTVGGTTGNVVVSAIVDIIVNHSQDIFICSQSGNYTELTIRILSNNDDRYYIQLKTGHVNLATLDCRIFPLGGEIVEMYTNNPAASGTTELIHVCTVGGMSSSATGGPPGARMHRNIITSTALPTPADGQDGDVWLVYEA